MRPKEMTKAEEQVMQILWKLEKCVVNDILTHFPDPKPAYTTVSTIVRILEKKGFVSHKAYGNTHEYFPLISKEKYKNDYFKGFLKAFVGRRTANSQGASREAPPRWEPGATRAIGLRGGR